MTTTAVFLNLPSPWLIEQKSFPPLGILYLASYLESNGFEVNVLDLGNKENSLEYELCRLEDRLEDSEKGLYFIYFISSTTPNYPYAKIVNSIIKKNNPDSITVIGGPHASSCAEQCLNDGFDHVVVGEGEVSVLKIVQAYNRKERPKERIIKSSEIQNIDSIPFPDRDLIDIKSYGYKIDTGIATTMITSRGCAYRCGFCSQDIWSNKVRFHSPDYVEKEIDIIVNNYGFKNILFLDDCFTLGRRFDDLLKRIKKFDINWRCYARADNMNKELLVKMKEAGCSEIGIGIESGSQNILDRINKKTKVEDNLKLIKDIKDVGIASNAFVMIGLPGETLETVRQTSQFMEQARPDKFGYNIFIPYFGTPIFKNRENYDIKIYEMPEEGAWTKGKELNPKSYVSTDGLNREEIERIFVENFTYFTDLIKFRPGIGKLDKK